MQPARGSLRERALPAHTGGTTLMETDTETPTDGGGTADGNDYRKTPHRIAGLMAKARRLATGAQELSDQAQEPYSSVAAEALHDTARDLEQRLRSMDGVTHIAAHRADAVVYETDDFTPDDSQRPNLWGVVAIHPGGWLLTYYINDGGKNPDAWVESAWELPGGEHHDATDWEVPAVDAFDAALPETKSKVDGFPDVQASNLKPHNPVK